MTLTDVIEHLVALWMWFIQNFFVIVYTIFGMLLDRVFDALGITPEVPPWVLNTFGRTLVFIDTWISFDSFIAGILTLLPAMMFYIVARMVRAAMNFVWWILETISGNIKKVFGVLGVFFRLLG